MKRELSPTMKLVRLWSISMAIVIISAFGILSIVLALIPLRLADEIDRDHVLAISIYNAQHTHVVYPDETHIAEHNYVLNRVMDYLENGRRTNRFANTFFQGSTEERISATAPTTVDAISGRYGRHYLRLEFNPSNPQFSLSSATGTDIRLMPASYNTSAQVFQIIIPLGNTERGFNETRWYLSLSANRNINFSHHMITYANHFPLANFTRDLEMPTLQTV